ncbi:hypothetical protein PHOBOS_155 [Erwinia phage vB_EamM_Phobos]|uniref:hypothetical protein n=1 Tax=Erwinia phage vB_EamM_Phobos TaxID=1883377 RepID=UPI00081CB7A4|nr:hypothetical protein BIZ79_gp155 [Erwinia phage vB_EamM_Phobos]ANZ50345.1 hypothetical protein PHOBOS_155 [Erwinia phage vB_EamM_Phobos]
MAKSLQEQFIDLINAKNPELGLALTDVDFGNPTEYIPETGTRNTALVLTAKPDSPTFKGSKEYHFSRFNLTHPNGEDTYSLATGDLYSNWLDDAYVLNVFNMNLTEPKLLASEVTITRTEVDAGTHDVKIAIDPNHLKWHGKFVIRVIDEGEDNLMYKSGELDGFN